MGEYVCAFTSRPAPRSNESYSLSLSLFLSLVCIHIVPDIRRKRKPLCLSVFLSLSETPKGTQTSFFLVTWCRRRVARNIWSLPGLGAGTGRLRAVRAKKKEQRVVGGENDDGRYKKYALAARRKRKVCIFSGKPRRETNSRSIDGSIDRSKVVSSNARAKKKKKKNQDEPFLVVA